MTEQEAQRAYDRASVALAQHHGSDPYHDCHGCLRVQRAWETSLEYVRMSRQQAAPASADQEA
jgi:hypothetical protein